MVTGDVNGKNMVYAGFSAGRFEETAPGIWTEFDTQEQARFTFK